MFYDSMGDKRKGLKKRGVIAFLGVAAAMVQLLGYGTGFIKAYVRKIILGKGRDISEEIEIRKGKNEKL